MDIITSCSPKLHTKVEPKLCIVYLSTLYPMPRPLIIFGSELWSPVMSENFAYRLWMRLAELLRLNDISLRNQEGSVETVDLKVYPATCDYYTRFETDRSTPRIWRLSIAASSWASVIHGKQSTGIYIHDFFNIITSMPWQGPIVVMGSGGMVHLLALKWLSTLFWCQRSCKSQCPILLIYQRHAVKVFAQATYIQAKLDWRHGLQIAGRKDWPNTEWDRTLDRTKFC